MRLGMCPLGHCHVDVRPRGMRENDVRLKNGPAAAGGK